MSRGFSSCKEFDDLVKIVTPVKTGVQGVYKLLKYWIPAFAGMTKSFVSRVFAGSSILRLPPSSSFFGGELGLGAGIAARFAEAPVGNPAFLHESNRFRKERREACGPALPMERPPPRGSANRAAVPAPLPGRLNTRVTLRFRKMKPSNIERLTRSRSKNMLFLRILISPRRMGNIHEKQNLFL